MTDYSSPYGKGPKPGRTGTKKKPKHTEELPTYKEIARLGRKRTGGLRNPYK